MLLVQRIRAFADLGIYLQSAEGTQAIADWAWQAQAQNAWFTPENVRAALNSIASNFLDEQKLTEWTRGYSLEKVTPRQVGVVMAGNIPASGFHDMLCVLMSGHQLLAKLSSQDSVLLKEIAKVLIDLAPPFATYIQFAERLNDADVLIATESNNSTRYLRYYFGKKPHIIRQKRTSCAVLRGDETAADLWKLGQDITQYFGLGGRNVSKLFVPAGYDFRHFFEAIQPLSSLIQFTKYNNNYDYNKSIYLVNRVPHLDNGFLLLTENPALVSPISVVYYEKYFQLTEIEEKIDFLRDKIQCIVTRQGWVPGSLPFGESQQPGLADYADGIDTLQFLTSLSVAE